MPGNYSKWATNIFDSLVSKMDYQLKNNFECFLVRRISPFQSGITTGAIENAANIAASALVTGAENILTKFFLYSIEVPECGYETERFNGSQFTTAIAYPETVTMVFNEDSRGAVRRYMQYWSNQIATPKSMQGMGLGLNMDQKQGRVFKNNQNAAKRDGRVILIAPGKVGLTYPSIIMRGLKFKSIGPVTIGHGEAEHLQWTVTMTVDDIRVPLLI